MEVFLLRKRDTQEYYRKNKGGYNRWTEKMKHAGIWTRMQDIKAVIRCNKLKNVDIVRGQILLEDD